MKPPGQGLVDCQANKQGLLQHLPRQLVMDLDLLSMAAIVPGRCRKETDYHFFDEAD